MLVVDADLLAVARIRSAAERAGLEVAIANSSDLAERKDSDDVRLLVLDLDRGREPALDALDEVAASGGLTARVIAFVSHVDEALAQEARARGYETLPRGRFWRSLGDLVRR